ncbi:MAG: hypothetical protein PHH11_14440 [Methylomonas sp.]|nr:hypothetical protein [Methylomonas sp.]
MAKPPKSEKDQPPWQRITLEVYRAEANELVHFSAKIVNSNAEAFGVRLGLQSSLPMPYVSARCLMEHGLVLGLDYIQNPAAAKAADGSKKIDVIKQIKRVLSENIETIEASGENLSDLKTGLESITTQPFISKAGLRQVSPRLRQLLLPKGDDYVAITPLPSAGMSQAINHRVQAHNNTAKENGRNALRAATLGIGGSNPQNVGSLVKETQTAWVFSAPTEDPAFRAAWAIHHRGITIRLPYRAMLAWKTWREQTAAQHGGQIPTDMRHRDRERQLVLEVAQGVLTQGRKALRLLEKQHDSLGEQYLSDALTDTVIRGLIDPSQRDKTWPGNFAERIATAIGRYKTGDDLFLPLDAGSLQLIARWLEEAIR